MKNLIMRSWMLPVLLLVLGTVTQNAGAFGDYNSDKILLSDLKALTLHQGQMTNARRSPPVPQLKCVGGSAQHRFQPKVVQCINQGSNGYDIQWECKTDMDNNYRFGHVEVSCEGYDYPNDPYVLKGSCGLEYTIEFTEEGLAKEKQRGGSSYSSYPTSHKSEGGVGGLFMFLAILCVMYIIYKTCIAPDVTPGGHRAPPTGTAQPPPYGFRPEFQAPTGPPPSYESTQSSSYCDPGFTSSAYSRASAPPPFSSNTAEGTGGGGFWSGAATGGVLGYMFGQGNNRHHYNNSHNRGWGGSGWGGSGWGGSGWGGSSQEHHHHHHHRSDSPSGSFFSKSSSSPSSGSSGTRTASGFGGTSRR
ncbi:store-operated calcium entry-associated regulatory factor [Aplysia californica]|uniref:Store-operated calcium entry-associated regulatory factor n=1 Tax=Aplysia californica TaxID=6500 RepID=A0ABM0JQN8_APLCA|nr:store-operated calcium entry-associated regulatory factor [Aplysia californica]